MKFNLREVVAKFNNKSINVNMDTIKNIIPIVLTMIVGWNLCMLFINKFHQTVNFLPILMISFSIIGLIILNKIKNTKKEEVIVEE